MTIEKDLMFMQEAVLEAKKAQDLDEVPVGAVAVLEDTIITRSHNLREKNHDPLGHAELLLLREVASKEKNWRLTDVSLYVTCEPCLMCAGAIIQARIKRLVFGCFDPVAGACGSFFNVFDDKKDIIKIDVNGGVMLDECANLLSGFFREKRGKK